MRKPFIVSCTVAVVVLAAVAIESPRAEAMTIGSPAGLRAAIQETTLPVYYNGYYPPYAYYRYVCRGWWKACGWEHGHYWNYWPRYLERSRHMRWRQSHRAL